MKILSLGLSSTELFGVLLKDQMIITRFRCALHEFDAFFFPKLDLDPENYFTAYVLPELGSLFKQQIFPKISERSLKKTLSSYEKSLFFIEPNEQHYLSFIKPLKNHLLIQTHVVSKTMLHEQMDLTASLSLNVDYLGIWQPAFFQALKSILAQPHGLYLYLNNHTIFILVVEEGLIKFSTYLTIHPLLPLDQIHEALRDLQQRYHHLPCFVIGATNYLAKTIHEIFINCSAIPFLEDLKDLVLVYGNGLLAQKNEANFCRHRPKFTWRKLQLSGFYKQVIMFNYAASLILVLFCMMTFSVMQIDLRKEICNLLHESVPMIITQKTLSRFHAKLDKISLYSKYIPEAPTPSEILAFLSQHSAFISYDKNTIKNGSIADFSYQIYDSKTAKVLLKCSFPKETKKNEFEKDLLIKKITFKVMQQGQLYYYELFVPNHAFF